MASDGDDGEAIRASIAEPAAFTTVFDRHFAVVHTFLRRRVGPAIADDLAAETFLRAFEFRSRYDLERPDARPWLFGIAVNLLRRHYRDEERQLRAFARSGIDPVSDATEDVDARTDAAAAAPELAAAFAQLRREERDVLLLHAWAELDYEGISEALGVPIGTVRSRLSRGRARLRELLRVNGQDADEDVPATSDVSDG